MVSIERKPFKTEFAVEMSCQDCVDNVTNVLHQFPEIHSFNVDLSEQRVMVEGFASPSKLARALKDTGRTVVVRGQGAIGNGNHAGAAVCIFDTYGDNPSDPVPSGKRGLARFVQIDNETCLIDLTVQGLSPGKHGVHIHEAGDISRGWLSVGDHFNPTNEEHGQHVGDLGNVEVDQNGWGDFLTESTRVKVWDIIGRSMVITRNEDDMGKTKQAGKPVDSSGPGILCGIIARSAGAFDNTKKVCSCSGKTMWEEARLNNGQQV